LMEEREAAADAQPVNAVSEHAQEDMPVEEEREPLNQSEIGEAQEMAGDHWRGSHWQSPRLRKARASRKKALKKDCRKRLNSASPIFPQAVHGN
ncbi:MAG: hypothetical protein RSC40_02250, partial [Clostridia bacterium]